ncbi:hypothetical protein TVAG_093840 [Trichomonas vaginalis G3]|uniref:Surface antigen BspA-like n=1 Tax=Trichomonas vaginalis (strain ATCC PRA-98 / G3) TaxID=412133 RepID=A2DBK7_TRIV3|nr:ribonuclease inhibitor domain-containing protein [Trichomonas vaginalis G3]EAY22210.1 hypothetical protein TVAG_093840 [Trichomonas vaginalis G3]KAI5533331.1 ribonuclease inhibitor domain-containing protein [Trichomonas vaginalis G3]|eukprot:XP_001583196.1 hypothetical protein [Trichomonas vaginalis G3]
MNYRPFQFRNQVIESISINEEFPIYCFYRSNITNINLGNKIEMIPSLGFAFSTIESINLENIKFVSSNAFSNCEKLVNVSFSDKLEYIGQYAFYRCKNLEFVKINSNKIIEVGISAFSYCFKLNYSNIISVMSIIPEACFYFSFNENSNELHHSCKIIEKLTFYMFHGNITLNEGLEFIGDSSFQESSLTSIIIPSTVRYIDGNAFYKCSRLERIEIPSSVTYLGDYCFSKIYDLKSAIIGEGITKLPLGAFYECMSLSSIIFLGRITSFGSGSLGLTNISNLKLPPFCICEDGSFGFNDVKMIEIGYDSIISFGYLGSSGLNIVWNDNVTLIRSDYTYILQLNLYYVGNAKYDHEIDQSLYYLLNFNNQTKVYVTPRYRSCTFCGVKVIHTYFNPFEDQISLFSRIRRLHLEIEQPTHMLVIMMHILSRKFINLFHLYHFVIQS